MNFQFNTIYVIESLGDDERKTGYEIWHDQLQYMPIKYPELKVHYKDINTLSAWDGLMKDILSDVSAQHNIPTLHLEIHGEEKGRGLVFKNGELADIEHIGAQLRAINIETGCNLMLTLGVCKGLYLLFNMHLDKPMPFIGAVGSFDDLKAGDIILRYSDFYETLFNTFDVGKAYISLMESNTGFSGPYRFIPADELYYKNYQCYINTQCTQEALEQRAKDSMSLMKPPPINRQQRRKFIRQFVDAEKKNRLNYFREHCSTFFMLKEYPENKERFNVPQSFEELKKRYENTVFV